jgi:transcriptional regulator with XRE-family HTH domain
MRDLAERSGVHIGVIGCIEIGRRVPSRDATVALARVFRRSIEHILFGLARNGKLWKL